jgi:hypothetical protein
MKRSLVLIHALRDAIDWEESLLDAMANCNSDSEIEYKNTIRELVTAYRKEFRRLTKSDKPYPAPLPGERTITIQEAFRKH